MKIRLIFIQICMIFTVLINAQEKDSWWQTDGSLKVDGSQYVFRSPIFESKENIKVSEMVLVNLNTYRGEDQADGIDYGIYSKNLSTSNNKTSKLSVYHRKKIDNQSNPNTAPLFGFDFTGSNYLIYGCETELNQTAAFKNQEESWNAYGYYAHGWSFSKTQIKSTDYKHLWNRPKSASWWDTIRDVTIGAIIVIIVVVISIVTMGGADVLFSLISALTAGISALTLAKVLIGLAVTSFFALSYMYTSLESYSALDESEKSKPLIPQKEFETNMELLIPKKFSNPSNDAQRNWNETVNKYLKHSLDCQEFPGKKCYKAPLKEVVVELDINDAHVKFVNIPGAIHKDLTPYQLFKNYQYVVDKTGTITAGVVKNVDYKSTADFFDSKTQILPRKIVHSSKKTTLRVSLQNFEGISTYYMISKDVPKDNKLLYRDLGVYGRKGGVEYRLYRFQVNSDHAEPVSFATGPKGPFLAGDNITIDEIQLDMTVVLSVNGATLQTINYPQDASNIPTLNLTMGDDLKFEVSGSVESTIVKPEIYGLPKVWEAPFAGDMYFHCDPNFGPNSINPFIGLDSRVHTLMLRPFPDDFKIFENGWSISDASSSKSVSSIFEWTYTAQREMDPQVRNYKTGYYKWQKKHKKKDGKFISQRQNQKEGLNMKFLSHWKDWDSEDATFFGDFSGVANYMMGFDDDELAYFNHRYKETGSEHPIPVDPVNGGVAKLETLQWKQLLEGEAEYDLQTGYPTEGHPLNIMVNAFRKHQYAKYLASSSSNNDSSIDYKPYHGYEIQDIGTDQNHPSGTGAGNLKHPGLVTIKYGNIEVKVKLKVDSPIIQNKNKGFYSSLVGVDAPSNGENNIKYYLAGVEGKSAEEQKKYKINYKWMNRLGTISSTSVSMYDIIQEKNNSGFSWISWKLKAFYSNFSFSVPTQFDLARPAYSWVTATYQRNPSAKPVIVAGKELNQIFLMFCGVKTLNDQKFPEGKGHGGYIWLEDFRNQSQAEYTESRNFGVGVTKYAKKYMKEYVFKKGDKVVFTTFDGDPHRLDNDEEEWYLSNRSMSKRVKGNLLYNSQEPSKSFLKYYIGPTGNQNLTEITSGRSGKELNYTFDTAGIYDLRVAYRNSSDLYLRIKVVEDYDGLDISAWGNGNEHPAQTSIEGGLVERDLTSDEKKFLGLNANETRFKAYEVRDVLTNYLFKDGLRSYALSSLGSKLANRWSKYNDYSDHYNWYFLRGGHTPLNLVNGKIQLSVGTKNQKEIYLNDKVNTFLAKDPNPWMWKDWANHYSSVWKGKLKVGALDGLPPYVPNNTVKRLNQLSDLDTNFGTYIDNEIFADNKYPDRKRAPWQYVIPLASTTIYHGFRQRTNPSCIYDMRKVFDRQKGAFSGNPLPLSLSPHDIQAPEISDEDKNKQDFYYNLKYNRILISPPIVGKVRAYNLLEKDKSNKLSRFVSERTFGYKPPGRYSKSVTNKLSGQLNLYPNESSGIVFLALDEEWTYPSLEVRVYDFNTSQEVYSNTFQISKDQKDPIRLDLSHLKTGYYVLKGVYGANTFTKKIIIKK